MSLLNAPNALSGSRLVLAAAFPIVDERWRLALVVTAALTDCLDGLVARWLNLKTLAGVVLDPLGDKVFALVVLLTLCVDGDVGWWQLAPILSRDVVAALAGAVLAMRRRWSAGALLIAAPLGKIATVLEYFWFASLLTSAWPGSRGPLFALTAIGCVLAAFQYAIRLVIALRHEGQASPESGRQAG